MSKYCTMAFNGAIFGFANPQIRAQAFALQDAKAMTLTPQEFKTLLGNHAISSTHPMEPKQK